MTALAPPHDATKLWLPTLQKEIPRPWFIPDREALAEQRRIMEGTFFLVRTAGNGGLGEALICDPRKGGCGGKHPYLTLRCVEQPFSGLTGGLYAYFRVVTDSGLVGMLPDHERARYDSLTASLGGIPDLAASHPELARQMTAGLAPNDAQLAAVAVGVAEPIPPTLARKYRDRINARGIRPRFSLPGMKE